MSSGSLIPLVLQRKQALTHRIDLYTFCSGVDSKSLPLVAPGAHILVPVVVNGIVEQRAFSLCQSPENKSEFQIAVLCESDNGAASTMRKTFIEGSRIDIPEPLNYFPLHANAAPALLIAGGIGIAPLKVMVQSLVNRGRRFHLHYAGRSLTEMAFVEELIEVCGSHVTFYPADERKRMDLNSLLENCTPNTQIYVCGPKGLMDEVYITAQLLGISSDQIHSEQFTKVKSAEQQSCELVLEQSYKVVQVQQGQPLILALREAGVSVNYDCCVGDCGTCVVRLLSGQVEHQDHVLTPEQRDNGMMCLCVSKITSKQAVLDL